MRFFAVVRENCSITICITHKAFVEDQSNPAFGLDTGPAVANGKEAISHTQAA